MNDKQSKMWGEPISKEEALKELGHPSGWLDNALLCEFRNRLKTGQPTELDITGIRGHGGLVGYLPFLRKELKDPLGTGTGLVSAEEEEKIARYAREKIGSEIDKCRKRLAKLVRQPRAVANHLGDMAFWLGYLKGLGDQDPTLEPMDELQEMARRSNEKRAREIAELEREIRLYTKLFVKLVAALPHKI